MRGALHDAKKCLLVAQVVNLRSQVINLRYLQAVKSLPRTFRPTQGQFHAASRFGARGLARRALVEGHCDLCAERRLHFHRNFRRKKAERTIDMRTKLSPFFSNLSELAETPYLKPAGIS